ncbi:MAG: PIG-L family deacetylase [Deltaproteobacteria bacterium]|nr:PIG-L family deacetylase [Deltaproteobacteria bacterium]
MPHRESPPMPLPAPPLPFSARRALLVAVLAMASTVGVPMPAAAEHLEHGLSPHVSPQLQPAGSLLAAIQRLSTAGTVLYVAAHPDDENSRLLAWLAGERGLRAVYLSLTRGDGGQNLVGTEQDELLGVLRTHELLAARQIDGAEQRFTRARDLGYTKATAEALKIWGKDAVLSDVVRQFRQVRPDVVITRFTPRPPNHGHHTASAELAALAFAAAGDTKQFPGVLTPWQPARLLHNVTLFNRKLEDVKAPYKLDVGGYSPLHGRDWGEVAAASRSQHKSQGFGVATARGPLPEFFEHLAGTKPQTADPFSGIEFRWQRFAGGAPIDAAAAELVQSFDPRAPQKSLAGLAKLRGLLEQLPADNPYRDAKLRDLDQLLVACAGLWLEARTDAAELVPGQNYTVKATALLGLPAAVTLRGVRLVGAAETPEQTLALDLPQHASQTQVLQVLVPAQAAPTTPYWLRHAPEGGLHVLNKPEDLHLPVAQAPLRAVFTLSVAGVAVQVERAVQTHWTDPVRGERSRAVEVAPPFALSPDRPVALVPQGQPVTLQWTLTSALPRPTAEPLRVDFQAPAGWKCTPDHAIVPAGLRGEPTTLTVQVTAPSGPASQGVLQAKATWQGQSWSLRQDTLEYDHIPQLTVRRPAEVRLQSAALALGKRRIGYIPGPGDKVAEALQSVGYAVTLLPEARLATDDLRGFDAIVVGVRALNAQPKLAAHLQKLYAWVERGGRLIVQYHTNSRIGPLTVPLGPFPLEIGRERVTDETAPMHWQDPADPLLTAPNRLTDADMQGWVQERGLYFAQTWDAHYRTPLQLQDPGEALQSGALLVAPHGKGTYIYTGLAFFRQLPAGVPGAWRLFANLLGP